MSLRLPVFYWDTCIFLEHLREEQVAPAKRRAVLRMLQDNADQKNRIVTSALTHTEAIPKKITVADAQAESNYWGYFDDVYFFDVAIDRQVINLARQIRDHYYKDAEPALKKPYQVIGLGDAIHLATAIVTNVDEFHTRDKRPSGGNLGIMQISKMDNGRIAGQWPLKIIDPQDPQGDMLDRLNPPLPRP